MAFAPSSKKIARSSKKNQNKKTIHNGRNSRAIAALQPFFEPLEHRQMLSVSVDSSGWTQIGKSSDSRVIYVSNSGGSDSNDGLSQDDAVKTLNKAKSMLRSGSPDHMLLKRGDTWTESLGSWNKSGRSASEPMLIGAYGTNSARPVLKTGSNEGFDTDGRKLHDIAIIGIEFNAHTRDPESSSFTGTAGENGIRVVGGTDRFLLEDCLIDNYSMNVNLGQYQGNPSDVKLRRNVITDSYASPTANSSGIYASSVEGLTIEGNVLDRNAYSKWNSKIAGAQSTPGHGIYIQASSTDVVVKGNIISDSGSHGLQARGGGIIKDNLFLRNPIGMSFGLVNGAAAKAGGVSGEVSGNVFLDNRNIQTSGRGWGWAIEVGNTRAGGNTAIRNNIFANDSGNQSAAINLGYGSGVTNNSATVGINDLTISDNVVYNWYRGMNFQSGLDGGASGSKALNDLTIEDNDFQETNSSKIISHGSAYDSSEEDFSNNDYYDSNSSSNGWFSLGSSTTSLSSWISKVESDASNSRVNYSEAGRDMADYNASIGGSRSLSAFLDEAREQGKMSWNWKYTAGKAISYVASGYNRSTLSGSEPETPTTPTTPEEPTEPEAPVAPTPVDTTGPRITSFTSTAKKLTLVFSEDVSRSLSAGDIVLSNTTTNTRVSTSDIALSYDRATNTATITFPGLSNDELSDGSHKLSIYDQNVSDAAGNRLDGRAAGTTGDYITTFRI